MNKLIILTILLGIIPESLFMTTLICKCKNVAKRRIPLFILNLLTSLLISGFMYNNVYRHAVYVLSIYLIMWLLFKSHISDLFIVSFGGLILVAISSLFYFTVGKIDVTIAGLLDRIVIIALPFIFDKFINRLYNGYIKCWNRNRDKPNKIAALTTRNIALYGLNGFMVIANIIMNYIYSNVLYNV